MFDLAGVPTIDVTGLHAFHGLITTLRERGITVAVARAPERVSDALERAGITALLTGGRVFDDVDEALGKRHVPVPPCRRPTPPLCNRPSCIARRRSRP